MIMFTSKEVSKAMETRSTTAQIQQRDVAEIQSLGDPPEYSTKAPDRLTTPASRPQSSSMSMAPTAIEEAGQWPLATSPEPFEQTHSAVSLASQQVHPSQRTESHMRQVERVLPYAPRPSTAPEQSHKRQRSRYAVPEYHGNDHDEEVAAPAQATNKKVDRKINLTLPTGNAFVGLRSFSDMFSSSSGSMPAETSPRAAQPLQISGPFGFRHESGTSKGRFAIEEEEAKNQTQSVLLDIRPEDRVRNETSLPVNMPQAVSPIDQFEMDAGCGHNSVQEGLNPFFSPASPSVSVRHVQSSTVTISKSWTDVLGLKDGTSMSLLLFYPFFALTLGILCSAIGGLTVMAWQHNNVDGIDAGVVAWVGVSVPATMISCVITCWCYICRREALNYYFTRIGMESSLFWISGFMTLMSAMSTTAALASVAATKSTPDGLITWLVLSIIFLLLSIAFLCCLRVRRSLNRAFRRHRAQQLDDNWIEMTSSSNRGPRPDDSISTHRAAMHRAHKSAKDQAWKKFAGNPSQLARYIHQLEEQLGQPHRFEGNVLPASSTRLREYVEHLESQLGQSQSPAPNTRSASPNANRRTGGIFDAASVPGLSEIPDAHLYEPEISPRDCRIGLARSDSLVRERIITHERFYGASSIASRPSFENVRNENEVNHILSREGTPASVSTDGILPPTAEEQSKKASVQETYGGIPRSDAMVNLSSQAPLTNSITSSTVSSLIGSYANSETSGDAKSYSPLGTASEALGSHPVDFKRPSPMVTEAGITESLRSVERSQGYASGHTRHYSYTDGAVGRIRSLTPVEERSEGALV